MAKRVHGGYRAQVPSGPLGISGVGGEGGNRILKPVRSIPVGDLTDILTGAAKVDEDQSEDQSKGQRSKGVRNPNPMRRIVFHGPRAAQHQEQ